MAFCTHCGIELADGVNFCKKCGKEVVRPNDENYIEDDEILDELEDDEPEVEDCDEEPEKGPPSDCYATFEGRCVSIYRESGAIYRRIYLRQDVLNAQIFGDKVSITCEDGWHYIYTLDGVIVRSTRH